MGDVALDQGKAPGVCRQLAIGVGTRNFSARLRALKLKLLSIA